MDTTVWTDELDVNCLLAPHAVLSMFERGRSDSLGVRTVLPFLPPSLPISLLLLAVWTDELSVNGLLAPRAVLSMFERGGSDSLGVSITLLPVFLTKRWKGSRRDREPGTGDGSREEGKEEREEGVSHFVILTH